MHDTVRQWRSKRKELQLFTLSMEFHIGFEAIIAHTDLKTCFKGATLSSESSLFDTASDKVLLVLDSLPSLLAIACRKEQRSTL